MLHTKDYSFSAADKVISTIETENMHVDAVVKKNLWLIATHQKSSELIEELKEKFAK